MEKHIVILIAILVAYIIISLVGLYSNHRERKERKAFIAYLDDFKARQDEYTARDAAIDGKRYRLISALEEYNRSKQYEKWNVRQLRQDIKDLVKAKGGTW